MSSYPNHPIHGETGVEEFDVLIVGSGPLGATYARTLVDRGLNVVMVETGGQESRLPAFHKMNEISYQKDIDHFISQVRSKMEPWSQPASATVIPDLGPAAWRAGEPSQMRNNNRRNPHQTAYNNIPGASACRAVGGMATIWFNATPEFLKGLERPVLFPDSEETDDAEWAALYASAKNLIGVTERAFDRSIRHNTVMSHLRKVYPNRLIKELPLACHRIAEDSPYVEYHGADHVFGDMFTNPNKVNQDGVKRGVFRLLANTLCTKLVSNTEGEQTTVTQAEVQDLLSSRYSDAGSHYKLTAKSFVVAGGAIGTLQLLAASGFGAMRDQSETDMLMPNLGKYLNEQAMTMCQVVLNQHLVSEATDPNGKPDWWQAVLADHRAQYPHDPMGIPCQDPDTAITLPVSNETPWHVQIRRDGLTFSDPRVEPRTLIELVYFGLQAGVESNRIIFEHDTVDAYGMPQPTINYLPTREYADQSNAMMADMCDVASKIGEYMPGGNPTFLITGRGQHIGGVTRLGFDRKDSTTDINSKPWGFKNLFIGGSTVLNTPFAANPTLTAMALAIRGAYKLYTDLTSNFQSAEDPYKATPREWYNWLVDESDVNFPNHVGMHGPPQRVIS